MADDRRENQGGGQQGGLEAPGRQGEGDKQTGGREGGGGQPGQQAPGRQDEGSKQTGGRETAGHDQAQRGEREGGANRAE